MSKIANQAYLQSDQYKDATKFNARVELHKRFSTNGQGWLRWAFEQLALLPQCAVLEVGCGSGYLWLDNADRLPPDWHITLADFSPGMVEQAQRNLARHGTQLAFKVADVQALPFADAQFDAVIANHMLYHVPDRERAYSEIRRVLRPGGRFLAATNGQTHLQELHALAARLQSGTEAWGGFSSTTFLLENGGAEIERWFKAVELRRYLDGLVVPEAEPLVDFVLSMATARVVTADKRDELIRTVATEIAVHGPLRITKDSGLFLATRAA